MPATFLLTWNPLRWPWTELADEARRAADGELVTERWSSGNTKRIRPGDRLFLIRLGVEPRGIVASGWALSAPFEDEHWDRARKEQGDTALYVEVEFERLLDPAVHAPLPHADVEQELPGMLWSPPASGTEIPDAIARRLEALWSHHLGAAVRGTPDDAEFAAYEGDLRLAVVRHRRREQRVREAKLAAVWAATGRLVCEVPGCGFDFEARYGELGRGFAQVHHRTPLASGESPRLTSLEDVAVVCANCHAMVHRGGQCRPLESLLAPAPGVAVREAT